MVNPVFKRITAGVFVLALLGPLPGKALDGAAPSPADAARAKLLEELNRLRQNNLTTSHFDPPLPTRREGQSAGTWHEAVNLANKTPAPSIDPRLDRLISPLLLFKFSGTQPNDPGVRSVHNLLQSGAIAGVLVGHENIVSKAQLKDVLKFLEQTNLKARPFIAAHETGREQPQIAYEVGISFPPQHEVSAVGDPQYAYSTYASLGANLANFGFTMNFGPDLSESDAATSGTNSFGRDHLQAAVYAKTFIQGHKEAGLVAAPIIRPDETGSGTLKAILSAFPDSPVAIMPNLTNERTSINLTGDIRGALFCFVNAKPEHEAEMAVDLLKQGCDGLIIQDTSEKAEVVRLRIGQAAAQALAQNVLDPDLLAASSRRLDSIRTSSQATP